MSDEENMKSNEVKLPMPQNSVEFSINAKGLWSCSIKAYDYTIEGAYNKSLAMAKEAEQEIRNNNKLGDSK